MISWWIPHNNIHMRFSLCLRQFLPNLNLYIHTTCSHDIYHSIPKSIIHFRYLITWFVAIRWTYLGLTRYRLRMFIEKHIFDLVFDIYINDPIICMYWVTSTNFDDSSDNKFRLVSMGVAMELQSNISNLLNVSTKYFAKPH